MKTSYQLYLNFSPPLMIMTYDPNYIFSQLVNTPQNKNDIFYNLRTILNKFYYLMKWNKKEGRVDTRVVFGGVNIEEEQWIISPMLIIHFGLQKPRDMALKKGGL